MKTTTNRIQERYMLAKANLEAIEAQHQELEQQYIIDNGITNNGEVPARIWCIEDEAVFEKANTDFYKIYEANGLQAEINEARDMLKAEEDAMLEFAIHIAPNNLKATLKKGATTMGTIRSRMIEATLKLDVSTLPTFMRMA